MIKYKTVIKQINKMIEVIQAGTSLYIQISSLRIIILNVRKKWYVFDVLGWYAAGGFRSYMPSTGLARMILS